MTGLIVFTFSVMTAACLFLVGAIFGEKAEGSRLYDKCLVEHQTKAHAEVVQLCKERIK